MPAEALSIDVAIGVTIPARDARGRAARIGPVLDVILSAHSYPPVIERLLAVAAGDNVMRVLPPLIIDESHIKEFVERLSAAAAKYEVPAAAA